MKSIRKIPVPRLAALAAGIGVVGLLVWFMFLGNAPHRAGDSGESSPANAPGGVSTRETTTPPWSSEEQKAKAAEREARRRKTLELYAELTKGLPELQPRLEGIPPFEENGHERFRALVEARKDTLPSVPPECLEMLRGKRPWESLVVRAYLDKHGDLLEELKAISRVPSGEFDWHAHDLVDALFLVDGATIRTICHVLSLAAQDAAYNGHPHAALEWMDVLDRVSGHLIMPEDVPMSSVIMGTYMRLELLRMAPLVSNLFGQMPEVAARLDRLLEGQRLSPKNLARVWRGDVVSSALGISMPLLASNPEFQAPLTLDGAKKLMRVIFQMRAKELEAMQASAGFGDLHARLEKLAPDDGSRDRLSAAELEMFNIYNDNPLDHLKLFVQSQTQRQLALAAVRLAWDDGAPEKILAEIAASEPEPRKLHYDPATRTLTSEPFLTETEKTSIQVP